MGEDIVLGRIGHYFDAGNGGCSTALVVDVVGPDEPDDVSDLHVNVTAWHHGGEPFSRTLVPVDPSPSTEADHNSFHLTRQCPWSR